LKNKKVNYLLVVLVAAVWGVIGYRVFGALQWDDDTAPAVKRSTRKEVYNDYAIPRDTEQLHQNYRDPFGMVKAKDTVVKQERPHVATVTIPKVQAAPVNWDFIRYVGYIRNPGSNKLIAMIHLNGQELMLSEGETAAQLKLLKNLRDSIKINYNGKTKFITLKSGNL